MPDQPSTRDLDGYRDHEAVIKALPWYINGSLDDPERALVERHLQSCLTCRNEMHLQIDIAAKVHAVDLNQLEVQSGFAKLAGRIESSGRPSRTVPPRMGTRFKALVGSIFPLRALGAGVTAIGVIAAALVVQQLWLPRSTTPALTAGGQFRTLARSDATGQAPGLDILVAFKRPLPTGELKNLLAEIGAEVVAGPSDNDVMRLRLNATNARDAEALSAAIEVLKASGRVIFVEAAIGAR